MSSMSSSSTADELLQLVPRHSPQATEHSSPIFLHVHLRELQSVLQLQRTIFRLDALSVECNSYSDVAGWLAGWLAVTLRYCIKTAKPIAKLFRPSESPITLVF